VAVLRKRRVPELGPVWQVFGAPQANATCGLLLERRLTGVAPCELDMSAVAAALGGQWRGGRTVSTVSRGARSAGSRCQRVPVCRAAWVCCKCRGLAQTSSPSWAEETEQSMLLDLFIKAHFWQTIVMVGSSAGIAFIIGVPLARVLTTTAPGGVFEWPVLPQVLGIMVNVLRSAQFITLLVVRIPLRRLVVDTSIGLWAVVVLLTIASIPFFARVAEVNLREVGCGQVSAVASAEAKVLACW
jgi:hypothetical protein